MRWHSFQKIAATFLSYIAYNKREKRTGYTTISQWRTFSLYRKFSSSLYDFYVSSYLLQRTKSSFKELLRYSSSDTVMKIIAVLYYGRIENYFVGILSRKRIFSFYLSQSYIILNVSILNHFHKKIVSQKETTLGLFIFSGKLKIPICTINVTFNEKCPYMFLLCRLLWVINW